MTHYKVLGIEPNVAPDDIRIAYLNKILILRKIQKDPKLFWEQFMQIRRSYEFLSDDIKRKKYDSEFAAGMPGTAVEESANALNMLVRSYYFRWTDFSTFPPEFRVRKIFIEIVIWLILFTAGAGVAFYAVLDGEFDYMSVTDILTVTAFGVVFAMVKEIYFYIRTAIINARRKA